MIYALLMSAVLVVHATAAPQAPGKEGGEPPAAANQFPGLSEKMAGLSASLEPRADADHLFAVSENDGKRLLIFKQNQLERSYLLNSTVEQGTGEKDVYSSMSMDAPFVIKFHWAGGKIQVLREDTSHRADPGTPEAKALERSFPPSVIAVMPVISSGPAGNGPFAVSADALYLEDILDLAAELKQAYPGSEDLHPVAEASSIMALESLKDNLDAKVELIFRRSKQSASNLPDSRNFTIRVAYSISELPGGGFETRPSDPRVGYFQSEYRDYSSKALGDELEPYVRLANRWRLEKKEPDAPLSEPKKPITYWIDETVPEQYRPAVKAGILAWNAAFEAVGFKNAIVVKEVDKDLTPQQRATFNPADASYNLVRWFMGDGAGFAIGPRRVDPRTGEIYNASVSVSDVMARFLGAEAQLVPGKAGAPKGLSDEDLAAFNKARGAYALLQAQPGISPQELERFKTEYLTSVIMHEIGHTLGLRHNFKGHDLLPNDKLGQDGLVSSSVMDYLPPNIASAGQQQGPYFQTKLGDYDKWAIEYGYKPVPQGPAATAALKDIASRSARDPRLAYATDEDTLGVDPDAQRFTLGQDPVAYARNRAELARGLWSRLETQTDAAGQDLRESFLQGYSAYSNGVQAVVPIIGGVRASRQPTGDAFVPVSAAEQRRALTFLTQQVFDAAPVAPSAELVRRMGADRTAQDPAGPVPVDRMNESLRTEVLSELLDPSRLTRLSQRGAMVTDKADAFGPRDVIDGVDKSVWRELRGTAPKSVSADRRGLQREEVSVMIGLLGGERVPGDARAAVRGDLTSLSARIGAALKTGKGLDQDTRLHLRDIQSQIQKALKDGDNA